MKRDMKDVLAEINDVLLKMASFAKHNGGVALPVNEKKFFELSSDLTLVMEILTHLYHEERTK